MTIKAVAWVVGLQAIGAQILVRLHIVDLAGESHPCVEAGMFSIDTTEIEINKALASFVKSYAAQRMGVAFGPSDAVRLWLGVTVA